MYMYVQFAYCTVYIVSSAKAIGNIDGSHCLFSPFFLIFLSRITIIQICTAHVFMCEIH